MPFATLGARFVYGIRVGTRLVSSHVTDFWMIFWNPDRKHVEGVVSHPGFPGLWRNGWGIYGSKCSRVHGGQWGSSVIPVSPVGGPCGAKCSRVG